MNCCNASFSLMAWFRSNDKKPSKSMVKVSLADATLSNSVSKSSADRAEFVKMKSLILTSSGCTDVPPVCPAKSSNKAPYACVSAPSRSQSTISKSIPLSGTLPPPLPPAAVPAAWCPPPRIGGARCAAGGGEPAGSCAIHGCVSCGEAAAAAAERAARAGVSLGSGEDMGAKGAGRGAFGGADAGGGGGSQLVEGGADRGW
mmetsp:Transcript_19588/g.54815  ORF Transcript_19588/g.54815 Transcript_19588/m.54815 type:complete len:202 (-) Transcript_19588:403-1008(-)